MGRGSKTPEQILVKTCRVPDVHVVTHAKSGDDWFSKFCMVGGRISGFPFDLRSRPYNTPARKYNKSDTKTDAEESIL